MDNYFQVIHFCIDQPGHKSINNGIDGTSQNIWIRFVFLICALCGIHVVLICTGWVESRKRDQSGAMNLQATNCKKRQHSQEEEKIIAKCNVNGYKCVQRHASVSAHTRPEKARDNWKSATKKRRGQLRHVSLRASHRHGRCTGTGCSNWWKQAVTNNSWELGWANSENHNQPLTGRSSRRPGVSRGAVLYNRLCRVTSSTSFRQYLPISLPFLIFLDLPLLSWAQPIILSWRSHVHGDRFPNLAKILEPRCCWII